MKELKVLCKNYRTDYDVFQMIKYNQMQEKDYFNQLVYGMNDPYMQYKK